MKLSELKTIIREEIQNLNELNDAFTVIIRPSKSNNSNPSKATLVADAEGFIKILNKSPKIKLIGGRDDGVFDSRRSDPVNVNNLYASAKVQTQDEVNLIQKLVRAFDVNGHWKIEVKK